MKIELDPDVSRWVEAEVAAGVFPTAEDFVRHAVSAFRANTLRKTLDAAVAEGGSHTAEDARRYVREQLQKRTEPAASP